MKKNILMVYPELPSTYWSLKYSLPFIRKKAAMVPLGLLTVAALLPDIFEVKLVDMNVENLLNDDISSADLVFISAMIIQKNSFEKVIKRCNLLSVPVVAGGPYPTSSYEKITGVDYFVLNEAELTLPSFIKDYQAGTAKPLYISMEKPDLSLSPQPRYDLLDFKNYNNISLQTSRGCPFNCEFCDITALFGRVPRYKLPAQFIKEVDMVYKLGYRGSVFIVDDNFIGNKKKVKNLLHSIVLWQEKNNYPFTFFTEASINLAADQELLNLMVNAGFDMVFIGIETPDKESLKSCKKSQNIGIDLYDTISKIQKSGIEVSGGFIVGFDTDEEDIFDRQIEFIQNAGIPMAMVGILGVLPKTDLYNRLKKEGRLKINNDFSGNNTHELQLSFKPIMDEKIIVEGYKKIISKIYHPKYYFKRCYTFINNLPKKQIRRSRRIDWEGIRAFLLSLWKQGRSLYCITYFTFLFKVALLKTQYLPLAIEHSIKGVHFFKLTNELLKFDELLQLLEKAYSLLKKIETLKSKLHYDRKDFLKSRKRLLQMKRKMIKRSDHMNAEIKELFCDKLDDFIMQYAKIV